jgi:hypothetical protein
MSSSPPVSQIQKIRPSSKGRIIGLLAAILGLLLALFAAQKYQQWQNNSAEGGSFKINPD